MKQTTPHWIAIGILFSLLAAIGVKFVVLGNTAPADDGRTAVLLSPAERQMVLAEMRTLLEATQQVTEGLAKNDMQQVIDAATPVGSTAIATVDFTLRTKLPLEFKQLGFATHYAMDDIVSMAKAGESANRIQLKLTETMNNCIACHVSFQLPQIVAK